MGRPAHEPDFAKRRQVEALAGYGVPEPDIAGVQHVGGLVNPTALVARVLGKISSIAFQKPSAPSPMARSGAISRPRRLMSTRSSRQLCALSTHECTGTARSAVQRARPICSTRCVWRSPLDLRLRNLLADARFAKEFPRGVDLVVRHHDPARQHAERAFDDAHVLVGNESVDAGFGGRSRAKNSACPLFYRREKSRESARNASTARASRPNEVKGCPVTVCGLWSLGLALRPRPRAQQEPWLRKTRPVHGGFGVGRAGPLPIGCCSGRPRSRWRPELSNRVMNWLLTDLTTLQ